jgi:hypothetical protein
VPVFRGGVVAVGVGAVAVQRNRGHVPVDAGDVEAEPGDRAGADRADEEFGPVGEGVQRPADAVVVERVPPGSRTPPPPPSRRPSRRGGPSGTGRSAGWRPAPRRPGRW